MKVAVVGAGISGLISAYVLAKAGAEVVLFEKEDHLGGHGRALNFHGFDLDLGFNLFNPVTYPNTMELLENFEIDMEATNTSFSISLDKGQGYEWGSRNGLLSLFVQKKNILNPCFWQMIREVIKFKDDVINYLEVMENNPEIDRNETLGKFLKSRSYSELLQKAYLVPMCSSIWCCPTERVFDFSAFLVFSFLRYYNLLQLFGHQQWPMIKWSSHSCMKKIQKVLESRGCHIRTSSKVHSISTINERCIVSYGFGSTREVFDECVIATQANDALRILGNQATTQEARVLGAFQYVYSDIFLHGDKNFMPQNMKAWSAWNFLENTKNKMCLTYWLNVLQNLEQKSPPFFVTLNPEQEPKHVLFKWSSGHPIPSAAASKALNELDSLQGINRHIWFCGVYQGYGSHEDGIKAGIMVAQKVLGKSFTLLNNPKHMVPSLAETGARYFVTRFFARYISIGSLTIMEEGGTIFTFKGTDNKLLTKVVLKVHNPQFYWKIMARADLGLADAYINEDFSFVDKDEGLLNLIMVLIANRDANHSSNAKLKKKRGWWTPPLFTATIASAKYFFQHVLRQNTLTQARRNISRHYDLSNELFSLFLDDTMSYSCAIFKMEDEDLRVAQLRKMSLLIQKARINKNHHVLDIGCGWGRLAIEVVQQTGCRYTGITLSEEQLKYAEEKVKDFGLQDHIKFLLCDYRQLASTNKYDRIISCGMIESVGHEFMEDFFYSCESVLAENGLLVVQFISIPDERYDEHRLSSDFLREYIFPGGCLQSLSRLTAAMARTSRFCVEHLENIGIHYYQTLRCWKKNFLNNKSKIVELGFDEHFIRTWEYYFDYCAAGFKSRTIGDYQIVFSRPGNVVTFSDPYQGIPSTY